MKVKLSVIIVNWNSKNYLMESLKSIFENPPRCSFEVIVVDNNSDEKINDLGEIFQPLTIINNKFNYGFAIGNNIGFENSSGEYVMTLNPDAHLMPGAIDKLVAVLDQNEKTGLAAPVLTEQKPDPSQYSFSSLFLHSILINKIKSLFKDHARTEYVSPFEVNLIHGTGYVCRVSALPDGYFFVEDNFLFGEEYYLCKHILSTGYKILVVPEARLQHYISVTFKNDHQKLSIARKLGTAVGCNIRREQWGIVFGNIYNIIIMLENIFLLAALLIKRIITGSQNAERELMITHYRAIVAATVQMLCKGRRYLAEINREAMIFFNKGHQAILPPISEKI
jgi:GT2 family glycosyltransferase